MSEYPIFEANLVRAQSQIVMPDEGFSICGLDNKPGTNLGSLAILGAAAANHLTVGQALPFFGEHFDAVLKNPEGTNHANIRWLMKCDQRSLVSEAVTFGAEGIRPETIIAIWENRSAVTPEADDSIYNPVDYVIAALDDGRARVAHQAENSWQVNQWIKQAILLSFRLNENALVSYGAAGADAYDKVPIKFYDWDKENFRKAGFRVVPGAVVRRGAYIGKDVILMPSFVNIGAYVGEGTMVDTWATVGSCAQIGKNCHISGGAGIGGVLEPLQANPVIIEDNVFVGARSEVVEGVIVRKGAVLSMGVFIGKNTPIVDRTNNHKVIRGEVPENAVVMMGLHPDNGLICPQIVKYRDAGTDAATALNDLLRD